MGASQTKDTEEQPQNANPNEKNNDEEIWNENDDEIYYDSFDEVMDKLEKENQDDATCLTSTKIVLKRIYDRFLVLIVHWIFFIVGIIAGGTLYLFALICNLANIKFDKLLQLLAIMISFNSIVYIQIVLCFFQIEDNNVYYLYADAFFFFVSAGLVSAFLCTNILNGTKKADLCCSIGIIFRNLYFEEDSQSQDAHQKAHIGIDYNFDELHYNNALSIYLFRQKKITIIDDMAETGRSKTTCHRFTTMADKQYHFKKLFCQFDKKMSFDDKTFFILSFIVILKEVFMLAYIIIHNPEISTFELIDVSVVSFAYLYLTYFLNKTLGSNDLKRKIRQMKNFNTYIDFNNQGEGNGRQMIDVTQPDSFEAWDNARKIFLGYEKDYLADLEKSYFCLIFYYLFVTLVCASSYFDLNWIFHQGSELQQPAIIIMSSFNFIFLTVLLSLRFALGTEFNESFDEIEASIVYLLDIVTDLLTMQGKFFNPNLLIEDGSAFNSNQRKTHLPQAYEIICKRILKDHKSTFIPQNESNSQEKIKYKLEMMRINLQKIRQSVQSDKELHTYKFLNLIEVRINDFLFTLAIALITTLPTIVPKFIQFYEKKE